MSKTSDAADPPDFGGVTEADGLIVAKPADYQPGATKFTANRQAELETHNHNQINTMDEPEE